MTTSTSGPSSLAGDDPRIDLLEARMARLTTDVQDLAAALTADADRSAAEPVAVEPVFPSLQDWVDQYFTQVFVRPIGGAIRWCDEWADHPEALLRLEAMWRSWETLRLDPNLGMATWLTTYADALVMTLMSPTGPFHACSPDRHS